MSHLVSGLDEAVGGLGGVVGGADYVGLSTGDGGGGSLTSDLEGVGHNGDVTVDVNSKITTEVRIHTKIFRMVTTHTLTRSPSLRVAFSTERGEK